MAVITQFRLTLFFFLKYLRIHSFNVELVHEPDRVTMHNLPISKVDDIKKKLEWTASFSAIFKIAGIEIEKSRLVP